MGVPGGFHGGNLGGLVARHEEARFVAHVDRQNARDDAESSGKAEGRSGEFDVLALEEVVGGNGHHEHGARHVAAGNRVDELGLSPFAREDGPEIGHLHAHGFKIEFRAGRIHHPAVGDKNPERREVGAERHHDRGKKVLAFRQAVPAEEEEADEGRLKEEGH